MRLRNAPPKLDAPASGTNRDDICARMFAREERIRKMTVCSEPTQSPCCHVEATSSKALSEGSSRSAWDEASAADMPPPSSRTPAKTPMQVYAGLVRKRFMALQAERQEKEARRRSQSTPRSVHPTF
jgi:hypothetical protein